MGWSEFISQSIPDVGQGATNVLASTMAQVNSAFDPAQSVSGFMAAGSGGGSQSGVGSYFASGSNDRPGYESFTETGAPSYAAFMGGQQNSYGLPGWNQSSADSSPGVAGPNGPTGASAPSVGGGGWGKSDAFNGEIASAAAKYGVEGNWLKAMIQQESSSDWDSNNWVNGQLRGQRMLPFVGIFEQAAESWGLNFDEMIGNRQKQIEGMAKILKGLSDQYGGMNNATKVYFGGEGALNGGFTDENGMGSNTYYQSVMKSYAYLQSRATAGANLPTQSYDSYGDNAIVSAARKYVGTPYVWGGIPSPGGTPTGWDCSGMTYWLNQTYGDKSLPMGSHYQYDYAQKNGRLFMDYNQLKPGDLVFFNTGWQGGAGAELNQAGHVGIYIGNGQMIHAANSNDGTIISDFNAYTHMYQYMGAMSQGGGGGSYSGTGGGGSTFSGGSYFDWLKSQNRYV